MKQLGESIVAIGVLIVLAPSVFIRFSHPELTETQLLFATWQYIATGLVACLLGVCIEERVRR